MGLGGYLWEWRLGALLANRYIGEGGSVKKINNSFVCLLLVVVVVVEIN